MYKKKKKNSFCVIYIVYMFGALFMFICSVLYIFVLCIYLFSLCVLVLTNAQSCVYHWDGSPNPRTFVMPFSFFGIDIFECFEFIFPDRVLTITKVHSCVGCLEGPPYTRDFCGLFAFLDIGLFL